MRTFISYGLFAVSIYVFFCIILYVFQDKLLFFPDRYLVGTPASAGLKYEDVTIVTKDDVVLHGWFVPSEDEKAVLLFFHGNAGNISHRMESLEIFNRIGFSTLIIDYRGYGKSEGKPSEDGTYLDADAAWNYLVEKKSYDPTRIVIFGRSLGGGPATYLAANNHPAALILESTFTSVPELGGDIYWYFPVKWLSKIKYESAKRIKQVKCPVLIVHSKDDEIIPFKHGKRLFEAANEPKEFLQIQYGHNEGFLYSGGIYTDGIINFFKKYEMRKL